MNYIKDFREHGFVVIPQWIPRTALGPAVSKLNDIYPLAADYHSDPYSESNSVFQGDEFSGIRGLPFANVEFNLLAVHPHIVELAETLLGTNDIRIYSGELWAKYTGAANYDQPFHRDFLGHTLMVPPESGECEQVEIFLYLNDVPESLGPPHFVSKKIAAEAEPFPNWLSREERPNWYEAEVSAAGPAGTAVAYGIDTFHRGTDLVQANGARFTVHVSFRRASNEWATRTAWANHSHERAWYEFVARATMRQLLLFGFPPPGHPYWTPHALHYTAQRYPGLDTVPFMGDE